ncbi:excalibur calcium-binding domain-containing protein [Bacillus tianshenii]|uniref:excalibur calcium-binding domain-containing protein n=1 Tax=Sutcliffiella tianshenii TaxID=1463404 RepID=UPI001CD1C8BD|nr:excalibur calcium-binding domain-containing protein [Bacillus tianshenii]MCA1321578.1 excalibur calcium-binding domain-containing protein [Bacillus tianshenii]
MKKLLVGVITGFLLLQVLPVKGLAFVDKNCSDFSSKQAVMDFWYANGYSATYDPHGLDRDNDGLPCEVSKGEYDSYVQSKSTTTLQGWKSSNGVWYYYVNGKKHTGWLSNGGAWYYMDSYGAMKTGWQSVSGKWYFFNTSGKMQTGWLSSGGKWYYLNTDGSMAKGWKSIGGQWYFLEASGVMKSGWYAEGGKWYYLKSSGAMQTGWAKVSNEWYFFNTAGIMQKGWLSNGGAWYYLNANGTMATGWLELGDDLYFLYDNGVMAKNTVIDGLILGESGAWTGEVEGMEPFELPASVTDLLDQYGYTLDFNGYDYDYYHSGEYAGSIGQNYVWGSYDYLDMATSIAEELTGLNLYIPTYEAVEYNTEQIVEHVTITPYLDIRFIDYTW